jgi:hypothetical protein
MRASRTVLTLLGLVSGSVLLLAAPAAPLRVGPGPHLLLDDYFIASSQGLARVVEPPKRPAAPAIGGLPGPDQYVANPSISWDGRAGTFRMWYTERAGAGPRLMYRESSDGITWPGPGRLSLAIEGDAPTVMDEGPDFADAARRFKLLYFRGGSGAPGMSVAWSATGLSWTFSPHNPVHPYYETTDPRFPGSVGDILDLFHDHARQRYGALVKVYTTDKEFGLKGRTQPPGLGVRLIGLMTSTDFEHWTQPTRAYVPDRNDRGTTEFYGGPVLPRGELFVNFLRILRDDLPAEPGGAVEGIGYTVLAWSRDGTTWQRDRVPFFDRNATPRSWDRAMTWIYGTALRNDTVYFSYAGYDAGHKVGNRQIGIATIPRDRFVARAPMGDTATLRTPLLTTNTAAGLWLNANAAGGSIDVRVLDANGKELLGGCAPVRVDAFSTPVTCKQPLTLLGDAPFSLEFRLRRAKLYGFSFSAS